MTESALTVALTGAGGTIGPALLERLQLDPDVRRVLAIGRRETRDMMTRDKVRFVNADVRDRARLLTAIEGADVVVHMAFSLYGVGLGERELFAINVQGTRNVAEAAVQAGATRFVYTSSAAIYEPGGDQLRTEDAKAAPATRLFYARHKAQAELVLREALRDSDVELFIFRPCAIVGPHASGALGGRLPSWLRTTARGLYGLAAKLPPAVPAPPSSLQFVHEDDVAQALALAVRGEGQPGAYNLAGDGVLTGPETVRTAGLRPLPVPAGLTRAALGLISATPPLIPAVGWPELIREPLLVDTRRAKERLGWRPRFTSRQALEATRA